MAVKARELEGMTKAELIKALRASGALEAKLQKRIAKLEGQVAAYVEAVHGMAVDTGELMPQDAEAHAIGEAATKELARRSRSRAAGKHAAIGAVPVFPWEKK